MKDLTVSHGELEDGQCCLHIRCQDIMISLMTNHYQDSTGNWIHLDLFHLTSPEILALGNAIVAEAHKAKAQQERNNVQGGEPCQTPS